MNKTLLLKTGVRKASYLVALLILSSLMLMPEQVSTPVLANYPQSQSSVDNNTVIAATPIPTRKPDPRYGDFIGLRGTVFGFWGEKKTPADVLSRVVARKEPHSAKPSQLEREIRNRLKSSDPVMVLTFFRHTPSRKNLDIAAHDRIQAAIAAGFLYDGKIHSAGLLARQSADRSGTKVPMAGWVAGLSLWQQEQYDLAAKYFQIVADSDEASSWMSSAGAYWASRAHEKVGNNRAMMIALQKAAENPRTFYGLLAVQALDKDFDFNWTAPKFDAARKAELQKTDEGARAIDLVARDQYEAAERELLALSNTQDDVLRDALLAFASHADLPKLSMKLANSALRKDGKYLDIALYPVTPWEPKNGYSIDPALVHAVMRQESKFDTDARSARGAMGLMQILPSTAKYVSHTNAGDLSSPAVNIKIGQDYLEYLLKDKNVDGDLMRLLVAYNAGPGNLAKWSKTVDGSDDPLLFIEMIPVNETREYVEKVMASYWMYRLRDGKDVPTLRAVADGKPAQFAAMADAPIHLASAQ